MVDTSESQFDDSKEMNEQDGSRFARSIFLLPNLLTTTALFFGFYAIIAAFQGLYTHAAITIFVAMIADGLDGRVARMTKTDSAFGAEYDSLSDLVAFGLGPAILVYSWCLARLGKIGWLLAFFYASATAMRLARFNTQIEPSSGIKRYFYGLPSPSAAAFLASAVWLQVRFDINNTTTLALTALATIFAGLMMMTTVRYFSFKQLAVNGRVPFISLLLVVIIFVGIAIDPPVVLFLGCLIFALSGPVTQLLIKFKKI